MQPISDAAFEQLVVEWEGKRTTDQDQANIFYEQQVWPEVCHRFRRSVEDYRYRGLVIVGTGQSDTAALLIDALQPERVAALLTAQTRGKFVDEVKGRLATAVPVDAALHPIDWYCPDGDYVSTEKVYEGLKLVLEHWHDLPHDSIAIDVTGGMKPMTVGLEKASHFFGLTTVYVQSQYRGNKVIPGSQRFVLPPDPYIVFGDLEAAEAGRLAERHDYASALAILEALAQRSQIPAKAKARYTALATLARVYAAWDAIAVDTARIALDDLLAQLDQATDLQLLGQRARLERQRTALVLLADADKRYQQAENEDLPIEEALRAELKAAGCSAKEIKRRIDELPSKRETVTFEILKDRGAVLARLGSLYYSATRRIDDDTKLDVVSNVKNCSQPADIDNNLRYRYDFAALLLYRCLELMSQRRLAEHGVNPDEQQITLISGYKRLLNNIRDALVDEELIEQIGETHKARNKSILAHGFRLITRDECLKFKQVVDATLARFFAAEGLDAAARTEWKETHTFVALA